MLDILYQFAGIEELKPFAVDGVGPILAVAAKTGVVLVAHVFPFAVHFLKAIGCENLDRCQVVEAVHEH